MTDKELIQALKCCGSDGYNCGVCPCFNECEADCGNRAPALAADRLEALMAENERLREVTKMVPQWISVEELLPADKQDVLAISNDGVESRAYPANYDCGRWFDCFFMEQNKHTTHWMPMPSTEGGGGVNGEM